MDKISPTTQSAYCKYVIECFLTNQSINNRLITTTSIPIKIIKLEKKKYLKSEILGYHPRDPKGWKMLINRRAKKAVNNINRLIFALSYKYEGIFVFIFLFLSEIIQYKSILFYSK